jgi:hypothetical protein
MLPATILAAGSFIALCSAVPLHFDVITSTTLAARAAYVAFGGNGSMAAGWPKQSEWMSFDDAWYVPIGTMKGHSLM